jgi:hypothetical protein
MIFFLLESVWHGAVAFIAAGSIWNKSGKKASKKGFVLLKKG